MVVIMNNGIRCPIERTAKYAEMDELVFIHFLYLATNISFI